MCEKYYVYGCFVDKTLKYVGMGKGNRYKHCTSGKSSCPELNRDFYAGKKLHVELFAENLDRVSALHLESEFIDKIMIYIIRKQDLQVLRSLISKELS